MKKTRPQIVAKRAGQVVTIGNVIGSPKAAFATNHADWAVPQRRPERRAGSIAAEGITNGLLSFSAP